MTLLALLLDEPVTSTSPTAQIITAAAAAIAGLITAVATTAGLRRRRAAEAELAVPDPENSTTRLRERLTKNETRTDEHDRRITDLEERMMLHRAADIAMEAEAAPRRRRRAAE